MNAPLPKDDPARRLAAGLARMGLELDGAVQARLLAYLEHLGRWNRAYNLTAVADPLAGVQRHLLDSLSLLPHLPAGGAVADVGSGAGLPGIPLALARPDLSFLLVDSVGKKVRFLREVVRRLDLAPRVRPLQARVESLAEETGRYQAVTARAFAPLADICDLAGHLLAPGGCILAMKGRVNEAERAALPPQWSVSATHPLHVPGETGARHLVVLQRRPSNERKS